MREGKRHLIPVTRKLPNDGKNLLIEQTFAANGDEFCVTLVAQQGDHYWRKSMRGQFPGERRIREVEGEHAPDHADVMHALQIDPARHLGISVGMS